MLCEGVIQGFCSAFKNISHSQQVSCPEERGVVGYQWKSEMQRIQYKLSVNSE